MLKATLDAVANLTYPNFECILVINNTPDPALWQPVEEAGNAGAKPKPKKLDRYRLQRKAIVTLRKRVGRSPGLRRLLERMRLGADVLLRE